MNETRAPAGIAEVVRSIGGTILLQGVDIHGWDVMDDVKTMDDVRWFLSLPHYGSIRIYALDRGRKAIWCEKVPNGICNLRPAESRETDAEDCEEEEA